VNGERHQLASEDDDGGNDEERGEDDEEQTVNHRSHELPVAARRLLRHNVVHLRVHLLQ